MSANPNQRFEEVGAHVERLRAYACYRAYQRTHPHILITRPGWWGAAHETVLQAVGRVRRLTLPLRGKV